MFLKYFSRLPYLANTFNLNATSIVVDNKRKILNGSNQTENMMFFVIIKVNLLFVPYNLLLIH
jgi:hypothetical protein